MDSDHYLGTCSKYRKHCIGASLSSTKGSRTQQDPQPRTPLHPARIDKQTALGSSQQAPDDRTDIHDSQLSQAWWDVAAH